MTISRTSSRKSAPSFTSRRQRQARKPVRNLDPKRGRVRVPKKAQENAAVTATLSMRSSKSSTKTRRNRREQFVGGGLRKMVVGTTKKPEGGNKTYGSSQCETARRSGAGASD